MDRIERMFGVNESRLAPELLGFGDDVEGHGRLAAGFGAVNLDHAPAREAADAQRGVDREASAGNHTDGHQNIPAAQAHDRALTVVLFNLGYRCCEQFFFFFCHVTPRWRKVGTWACGADGRGSAPATRIALVHDHTDFWTL